MVGEERAHLEVQLFGPIHKASEKAAVSRNEDRMWRLSVDLWRYWLWKFCLFSVFAVAILATTFADPVQASSRIGSLVPLLVLLPILCSRFEHFSRLAQCVKVSRRIGRYGIVLYHPDNMYAASAFSWDKFAEHCARELEDLAAVFKFKIRGRLVVFVLPSHRDVTRIHGSPAGGFALSPHVVVLGAVENLFEFLRHELVHLFAARWGLEKPALLIEGLAVHLQGTEHGLPIDRQAIPWVRAETIGLGSLLKDASFHSEPNRNRNYLVAGSFTRYLIRRFGWATYARFYQQVAPSFFHWQFKRCFGMKLSEAERRWRNELLITSKLKQRMSGMQFGNG